MGVRTGKHYLDDLAGNVPEVYLDGEVVSSPAQHRAFASTAQTYAELYDLQHSDQKDVLTFESPTTADPVALSFLVPREARDLQRRREAMAVTADYSHGFLGRTADYMNSCLTALASSESFFSEADAEFAERISRYHAYVRENDLLVSHTLIPPQVNRSVGATAQGDGHVAARIVEERPDGIVIDGARSLATMAPLADELAVFPSTVLRNGPEDVPYCFAFAIPSNTPGLRYYCRSDLAYGRGSFDEPLASRFDEMDAVVVFDRVFVPNERVFLLGRPDLCNTFYSRTGAASLMTQQVVTRTLAKTEFYLGLAVTVADAIAASGFSHITGHIADLITFVELQRAVLRAAEVDGERNDDGVFLPRWTTLNAARNWFPTKVAPRLTEIIKLISASGLVALPSERDFDGPGPGPGDLDRYLQSAALPARERAALFKLAFDASVSGFAGRQDLYERFFFGDPVRMASALVDGYDFTSARARVDELLRRR